jgi:alanine racemase
MQSKMYSSLVCELPRWERDPFNHLIINLPNLVDNYKRIRRTIHKKVTLFAVLKSDAYGHGLLKCARAIAKAGCEHFAVESMREAILLRRSGIKGEILLMNPLNRSEILEAVEEDISLSVIEIDSLDLIDTIAQTVGRPCKIHLTVNLGINCLGIDPDEIRNVAIKAFSLPYIEPMSIYGEPGDYHSAQSSFFLLEEIYSELAKEDIAPPFFHFANSSIYLDRPNLLKGGVRMGILMYGVLPPEQWLEGDEIIPFKPVMSLTSSIVNLKKISLESKLTMGDESGSTEEKIIATIPIGYSHGLDRKLSEKGEVLVLGKRAPFTGIITMNSSTVDVTEIAGVKSGDLVTILGSDIDESIPVNYLAENSSTISGEVLTRLGKGVTKYYNL